MIEFRSLRQNELEAWFEHCAYVFGGGTSNPILKGLFINHYYMDPDRDLTGILVAIENGQILSTVRIFYRKVYLFGKELSLGGIGEVSTRPDAQGKGLAYRLLEDAVKQMKERKIDVSMLRGTAGIYHKLGWRKTTAYRQASKVTANKELQIRLRPADFERDIPVLKAIHQEYSIRFNGAFVRADDFYWRYWVRMEGRNVWIIEDADDQAIGYVSFQYTNECLDVYEFCTLVPYEGIFDQVACKICAILDRAEAEVKFESLIQTGFKAESFETIDCNMFMLVTPFSIDNVAVESTEALIERLTDKNTKSQVSDILFWGIDSF